MKKGLLIAAALLVIGAAALLMCPNSKTECCLCEGSPRHAPCLVNLETGELLELSVYDSDPFRPGELAEEQRTGYFTLVKGAGASGYRDGGKYVKVTIPLNDMHANSRYFCKKCRAKLSNCTGGYAIVDMLSPNNPVVFSLTNTFELRCYEVIVSATAGKQEITVNGQR